MKYSSLLLVCALLTSSFAQAQSPTQAADATPETADAIAIETSSSSDFSPSVQISLEAWLSNGEGEWEIEFGSFFLSGRSRLTWEDIDAPMLVLNAEVAVAPHISIGGSFGMGEIDDGQNTDGDWFGDFQFSESQADTDGDVTMADINVYYQLITTDISGKPLEIDVFLGYIYYKDDLRDYNGVQTLVDEQPVNDPFDGLNSKYRFMWQMAKIGVRANSQVSDSLNIRGSIALLHLIDYEGEGYWNLRDDFRRDDPNFVQGADDGKGVEAKVSLRYALTENVRLEGGYRIIYMKAEDGDDKTYFSDGTSDSTHLSYVETLRHGAFAALGVEF